MCMRPERARVSAAGGARRCPSGTGQAGLADRWTQVCGCMDESMVGHVPVQLVRRRRRHQQTKALVSLHASSLYGCGPQVVNIVRFG